MKLLFRYLFLFFVFSFVSGDLLAKEEYKCSGFRMLPCVPTPKPKQPSCGDSCKKLDDQLRRGCSVATGTPYADTIFLRKNLTVPGNELESLKISIASLSESTEKTFELLSPMLNSQSDVIRYASALQIVLAASRTDSLLSEPSKNALEIMRSVENLPFPKSDLLFFTSLQAEREGNYKRAVELAQLAGELEPNFFNSYGLTARLLIEHGAHLSRKPFPNDPQMCLKEYQGLMKALVAIGDLEPCARVAANLETFLIRSIRNPQDSPGLKAAQVYLSVLSKRADLAKNHFSDFMSFHRLSCSKSVSDELKSFLHLLEQ